MIEPWRSPCSAAGAAFVLFALMAFVIDASWHWANTLKVQRAADAAALAGSDHRQQAGGGHVPRVRTPLAG